MAVSAGGSSEELTQHAGACPPAGACWKDRASSLAKAFGVASLRLSEPSTKLFPYVFQFVGERARIVNFSQRFDDRGGINRHCAGLGIGVNAIQHQRLNVAVENDADQLGIFVDDRAAGIATDDVGRANEIERRLQIELARIIDAPARQARKINDAQDEIKKQAYADIAKARFAIEGANTYPDATFTLRLSYGTVQGYEQDGKQVPAFTDFAGLYQRAADHDNKPPFDLPKRWVEKKTDLDLATKFNFVSDADIIGGNSGSPVVNKANEFVGIIFDGNIQSLVLDCIYTDTQARAVSVDSAAIIEALRRVYGANPLADELTSAK